MCVSSQVGHVVGLRVVSDLLRLPVQLTTGPKVSIGALPQKEHGTVAFDARLLLGQSDVLIASWSALYQWQEGFKPLIIPLVKEENKKYVRNTHTHAL